MVPQFRFSPANKTPLRIGILLDDVNLLAVFARIVDDIQASNFAKLELLVYPKKAASNTAPPVKKSKLANLASRIRDPKLRSRTFYHLYLKLDSRMRPTNDPLDLVDCTNVFAGIESMEVEPIGKKFIQRFPPEAIEQIKARELDVILRFGFNILHGEILQSARYGVWSFHHGDNEFYRGGPAHFWELVEGAPLSGVILQVLTEELDGGLVLCKSQFATERSISVSQNRFAPYWGSAGMVIQKLNELHQFGWDYLKERAVAPVPYQGKRKVYRTPENLDVARWLAPILLKKAVRYPFRQKKVLHWRLAIRKNGRPLFEAGENPDATGFRWIEAPKSHFWADPFLIAHQGSTWLFFEDYSYRNQRGDIACCEVLPDGTLAAPVTCLADEHIHYSYPHVFHANGILWMTPESSGSNSVDLYVCQDFPLKWKKERTLIEGKYVDPTLWERDGKWWMAVTTAEPESRAGCLLLFYSASLSSEWRLHPSSPISTDIRNNRGAGAIIRAGDRLIRPSQSGSPIYGYSFGFHEIVSLTEHRYQERLLTTVSPQRFKGMIGVHGYARLGDFEVIDGQQLLPLKKVSR
jgi:hypothetical protein